MRLLLDAHALLWWLADDPALSAAARAAIADPDNDVLVSAATVWEISIKRAIGKLVAPEDVTGALADAGFGELPLTAAHAQAAAALPRHHDDLFDRMLIAQATLEGCTVITRDRRFVAYGIGTLPA